MVLKADRRLSYQLSYASKWTLLSRLMRKFHQSLVDDELRLQRLQMLFEEVVETFREIAPFHEFSERLAQHTDEFSANLQYALEIDFSAYDPSNFFHSLRVHPRDGEDLRSYDELGTGQEQILALAFAYAYAATFGSTATGSGLVLVVEEPESHLHPLAQMWLAQSVRAICAEGVQVLITTHSPAFVDLLTMPGLVLVRKSREGGETEVVQLTRESLAQFCRDHGAEAKAREETIAEFYAASATSEILQGLFARACVLVEGPTESLALPVLLRRAGIDTLQHGIDVISVGGGRNLARWWRFFRAYGIPTYVILDRDAGEAGHAHRTDVMTTLSIDLEEGCAWPDRGIHISESYAVMCDKFEDAMEFLFADYPTLQRTGQDRVGASKPLVARYAVERLDEHDSESGWQAAKELGQAIRRIAE